MTRSNILFWIVIFASLMFFHTRGFISHDEGWVLNAASRILDGEVPYRDFYFLYTPGSIFSVALWFKLFGKSILFARILALAFSFASSVLIYKITNRISNHSTISAISVILFLLWGPFQINFVWMVMLSITSGLATVYFLMKSNKGLNFAFAAGIAAALTLLFKQNFGLAIILVSIIAFIFNHKLQTRTQILNFVSGFFFIVGLLVIYLWANNSLLIFIEQMYYFNFQKILIEGMLSSPLVYPDALSRQILKTVFYLTPAILASYAIYLTIKRDRKIVFLPAFSLLYYVFSIRPTTDLVHLAPLMAISIVPLSVVYKYSNKPIVKKMAVAAFSFLILLGLYSILFRGYYRWESPILSNNYFYKHPKINIFVNPKFREVLYAVEPELRKSASDYIFVYHFAPMFYFVSDKKNPTYYDDLQPRLLTEGEQKKIISNLQKRKVDTILTNSNLKVENSMLTKFILNSYYPFKTVHDYTIWKLK